LARNRRGGSVLGGGVPLCEKVGEKLGETLGETLGEKLGESASVPVCCSYQKKLVIEKVSY
jgi:hypothetical protein